MPEKSKSSDLGSWCSTTRFWKKAERFSWSASDSKAEEEAYSMNRSGRKSMKVHEQGECTPHDDNAASAPRSAKNTSLLKPRLREQAKGQERGTNRGQSAL